LSRCVTICPIGHVDDEIIKRLTECITSRCGLVSKVSPGMENPKYAYNESRCQYNSKLILKRLIQDRPHATFRLIGITQVDLYIPILTFVFGLAQIEGPCGVISMHRLYPEFYDQPSDFNFLMNRIEKTALHELGHTMGLTHCRDRRCVMYSSTRIGDTDFKQPYFCPTCFELFNWYLENSLP